MNVIDALTSARPGSYVNVTFRTSGKPAAKHKGTILEKITRLVCRAGIEYANLGAVKEGIEAGDRGEVGPLPWGKWTQYPYVISHNEQDYVRLYPPHRRNKQGELVPTWTEGQIQTTYMVNGQEVTGDQYRQYLTPSDAAPRPAPHCFTVKAGSIMQVGDVIADA